MTFDDYRNAYWQEMRDKGHELILDDGEVDQFVTDGGHCNGPGCSKCGWTTCMHCVSRYNDWQKHIPVCK